MNDTSFAANPIVTIQHCYGIPPVGRSLWRKRTKDGDMSGIKAKTVYPTKPESWPEGEEWPPDKVLSLIQAGMLNGKSIGFQAVKIHQPDNKECEKMGWEEAPDYMVDEWLLLEYACCFLPANQQALVEAVSRGSVDLPPEMRKLCSIDETMYQKLKNPELEVPFTPIDQIEAAITRALSTIDITAIAVETAKEVWAKATGKV